MVEKLSDFDSVLCFQQNRQKKYLYSNEKSKKEHLHRHFKQNPSILSKDRNRITISILICRFLRNKTTNRKGYHVFIEISREL